MLCTAKDIPRLNALFGHESIWPFIKDDFTPDSFRYKLGSELVIKPNTIILSPTQGSAFVFVADSCVLFSVHANVIKRDRAVSKKSARDALLWVFNNTDCMKVYAHVSSTFKNVCRFTESMGFVVEGVLTKSLLRDGALLDQTIYGLTKQDFMKDVKHKQEEE